MRSTFKVLAPICLLAFILRAPSFFVHVFDPDEADFAANAAVLLDGGKPYVDFFEKKPPAIYYTYLAVFLLKNDMRLVHLLVALIVVLETLLVYGAAREVFDRRTALFAAFLFAVFSPSYVDKDMLSAHCEVIMNLPLLAGMALMLRAERRGRIGLYLSVGALFGLATLVKHQGGINLLVAWAYLLALKPALLGRRRFRAGLRPAALVGAGYALPILGTAGLFWAAGLWQPFFEMNVIRNLSYIDHGSSSLNFPLRFLARVPPFLLATAPLWYFAQRQARRWWTEARDPESEGRESAALRLLLPLWLLAVFVPVSIGGRFYTHYFVQFYPPLALAACYGASLFFSGDSLAELLSGRRRKLTAAFAAFVVVGFSVAAWVRISRQSYDGVRDFPRKVAEHVRRNTDPSEKIFVWGHFSMLYYFSKRLPASRFVYCDTLAGAVMAGWPEPEPKHDGAYIVQKDWDALMADFKKTPPALVVDTSPADVKGWSRWPPERYPRLMAYLDEWYELDGVVEKMRVYRRLDKSRTERMTLLLDGGGQKGE